MPFARGRRRVQFPLGSFATATWTIPRDYGGMTAALLRRSRVFVQEAGVPVRIVTFDPGLDVPAARSALELRGELVPGVTLHNVWEDLRALPDDAIGARAEAGPLDLPRAADATERVRTVVDDDGQAKEMLHFRVDGSLAAVDRRSLTGRRVTLYTSDGRAGRHWGSVWGVYRHWLRSTLPDRPAWVVVDSKSLVTFFANLKLEGIRTAHVVHGAHLVAGAADAHGDLTPSRRVMVENFERFDAVVFLTDGQRSDVLERIGPRSNAFVIPNSAALPDVTLDHDRDVLSGVVLASLNGRKRVGHAIKGVGAAADRTGLPVRLDVFGDGPERERLERLAARVPGVTLHGYVPGAASRLEQASFLLLTSRSEGLPLVFAEAMSRGCVPIAYDIRYGPADIITHGTNGFLVPDGDVDGLGRAIERLVTMEQSRLRRMREAARTTALDYSDRAVAERWAELFWRLSDTDPPRRWPLWAVARESVRLAPRAVRAVRRAF